MPFYDYRCGKCAEIFEELVSSSSVPDEDIPCPRCGARRSKRLIAAPSIMTGAKDRRAAGASCSPSSRFT